MRSNTKSSSSRTSQLPAVASPQNKTMEQIMSKLFPLWQQLQISQPEAGLAYQQLSTMPQKLEKYAKMLQDALQLKLQYETALKRYKVCCKQFMMAHEDPRTALLAAAEYKTQLFLMFQLNQDQRAITQRKTFLPWFDYKSHEEFMQAIVEGAPSIEALVTLFEQSEFCIQTDSEKLVQNALRERMEANSKSNTMFVRSPQYAAIEIILGIGLPGSVSEKFKKFTEQCLEEYYLVEITSFNPGIILKTIQEEGTPLSSQQKAQLNIKIPCFGTSIPGYNDTQFCGYSRDTARYGQQALPKPLKAPGYTKFLLSNYNQSEKKLSRIQTRRPVSSSQIKTQTIQEQQSTTVLFLRQYYNDGELYIDQQLQFTNQTSKQNQNLQHQQNSKIQNLIESDDEGDLIVVMPIQIGQSAEVSEQQQKQNQAPQETEEFTIPIK